MLFENPFPGTSVTKVTAVDADDPTVAGHATVTYQVIKGDEYFTVDDSGRSDMQTSLHFLLTLHLGRECSSKPSSFWTKGIITKKNYFKHI